MGESPGVADGQRETVTFLFTDIEGSTRLLGELGASFEEALLRHHAILREMIARHDGWVRRTEGDSFFATFPSVGEALAAAADIQRGLAAEPWPPNSEVRVRIGVHTGEATARHGDYVGLEIHRAARVMSVAWGGQVVVTQAALAVAPQLPAGLATRDLGEHRLKDLAEPERLHQVLIDGLPNDFPPLRSLDAVPNNLPMLPTAFVGRQRELDEVVELVGESRVVTLTGPGGTGKTRLALQAAAAVAPRFDGGVFFVPLGALGEAELVMSEIARVLQLRAVGAQTPAEVVTEYFSHREALLVLDNLEQIIEAGTDVAALLGDAPSLRVLATSRAPLRIYGEHNYQVPPMAVPELGASEPTADAAEAVALFVDRAVAVQPGFVLGADNRDDVIAVVRRLDGLPLAIELAAARIRLLTPGAIRTRLDDTFHLLTGGERDRPDRQRTIEAAIGWSHDLLTDPARRLFRRLAVFQGGADLAAIEVVAAPDLGGDPLDALSELVDHSLVQTQEGGRFSMLALIHEFARSRLAGSGDEDAVRGRHVEEMVGRAESAAPHLVGDDPVPWLDGLEVDHDNHRAALSWAVSVGRTTSALRLVAALWRMWQIRGHLVEAETRIETVLAMPDVDEHPAAHAAALEAYAGVRYWRGHLEHLREPYARALEIYEQLDDPADIARASYNLGFALPDSPAEARAAFERAMELYEQAGDSLGVASAHWGLTVQAYWDQDAERALEHGLLARAGFERHRRDFDLGWAQHMIGLAHYSLADDAAALTAFLEAASIFERLGDRPAFALLLWDFAVTAEAMGEDELAMRLLGAADHRADETGAGLLALQVGKIPRRGDARSTLGEARADELYAEGAAWSTDHAIEVALDFARSSTGV